MGGRLYWRGGIFQRRRNVFNIGGADFVKLLTGGGGGGGGCSPLRRRGGVQSLTTGAGEGVQSLTTGWGQSAYDGGGGGVQSAYDGGGGGGGGPKYTSAPPPISMGGAKAPSAPRGSYASVFWSALFSPPPSTCDEQSIAN